MSARPKCSVTDCLKEGRYDLRKLQSQTLGVPARNCPLYCHKHHVEAHGKDAINQSSAARQKRKRNRKRCDISWCTTFRRPKSLYCEVHGEAIRKGLLKVARRNPPRAARDAARTKKPSCNGTEGGLYCEANTCSSCDERTRHSSHKVKAAESKLGLAGKGVGMGLYATEKIEEGEKIVRYQGRLIKTKRTDDEGAEKELRRKKADLSRTLRLKRGVYVDGSCEKNLGQYANHKCAGANAYFHTWYQFEGSEVCPRGSLVAQRDINEGEEITVDYGDGAGEIIGQGGCCCGDKDCRFSVSNGKGH